MPALAGGAAGIGRLSSRPRPDSGLGAARMAKTPQQRRSVQAGRTLEDFDASMGASLVATEMSRLEMDHPTLNQLRVQVLVQPTHRANWTQLSRVLTLNGDDKGAQLAAGLAVSLPDPSLSDEQPPVADAKNYSEAPSEELQTLEQLANDAAKALQASGTPWLVLSVAAGTITIAARQSSPRNARLFWQGEQSHVQVAERLVYRDPATGVRLTCLAVEPIRLADLQPRQLQEYDIEYAGLRCSLVEAMPDIKVPLRLQLEGWDGMRIRGWMGFEGSDLIPRMPFVVLTLDGAPLAVVRPTVLRLDVTDALVSAHRVATGFDLTGLRKLIRRESSELQFRDPFTYELYASYVLNRFRTFHQQIMQVSKGFCGFDFQLRDGEVVVTSLPRHRDQQPVAVMASQKLDILVPVYKNWNLTRQCLVALRAAVSMALTAHPERDIFMHATNDCSPEAAVKDNLAALCEELGIIHHQNNQNLGFISTVNNFMNSTSADVLLVNSDVIVSTNCIDELIMARERLGPHVASLTAFSNNATIFSYPRQIVDNPVSSPAAIERIAEAFRSVPNAEPGATHQVPVSHGFLMYLSRTALNAVGVFDEYFGKGYGEEVDWAVRAALKGFEHHICTTAYAFHKGSVSFGAEVRQNIVSKSDRIIAERYPFFDKMVQEFIYTDEFLPLRNQVALILLKESCRPIQLHISHSSGGGIDTYIRDLRSQDPGSVHVVLRPGRSYTEIASGDAVNKLFGFTLECDDYDAVILGNLEGSIIASLASLLPQLSSVVLHSFVGWKPNEIECLMRFLAEKQLSYSIIGHDYMTICPRIKLVDSAGEFCEVGDTSRCAHCLRTGAKPIETSLMEPYTSDIEMYREFFAKILSGAEAIICSTLDQADRFIRQGFRQVVVREPHEAAFSVLPSYQHDPVSRNVVLIGGVSVEKGAELLFHVASHCLQINSSVHFYLVGAASNIEDLRKLPNFTHVTSYSNFNELHDAVRSIYSPVAFFPAIWPETWCYTLSEALKLALPIIAPTIGAFRSRLDSSQGSLAKLYDSSISSNQLAEIICSGI
jgi:GT2 family glycosyltransferase